MNTKSFIVSDKQIELDGKMVPYDLWATKVHVLMLSKQKIIENKIAVKIIKALADIGQEYSQNKFSIDPDLGLHLTVEAKVIQKIGEDGYFMHTGRSRNDQVMTAELLYLREKILEILLKLLKLLKSLMDKAEKNIETIMPGYTHMQPAKPTTFGQWSIAYHDMFMKCFDSLQYCFEKYNLCPLGAVESYGTSWNIDRVYTAKLLGIADCWEVPQEAISSRGFVQLAILGGLKDIAIVLSKVAGDLLLFTTFEFGYVTLSDDVAKQMGSITGSSIMPQKKNPDVLELLRSLSPQIIGYESIVANLLSGLPMGYNRDTREVKEYIESGFTKVINAVDCMDAVIKNMIVNKKKMYKSVLENYSLSADLADYISQKTGLPYRRVYKLVGLIVKIKMEKKLTLTSLTAKELNNEAAGLGLKIDLKEEELQSALDPAVSVMKRNHIGGSVSQVMEKMITKRKKLLKVLNLWVESARDKIEKAKILTQKEICKL